jgi:hypothetical protein
VRCTTGAGGGGGAVLVLEKEKQPEPSVAAARTNPIAKNFIMQVPKRRPRFACGQPYPATTTARSVHAFGRRFKPASINCRIASDRETSAAVARASIASMSRWGGRNATNGVIPVPLSAPLASVVAVDAPSNHRGEKQCCSNQTVRRVSIP